MLFRSKALCQIDDALNGVDADRKMKAKVRRAPVVLHKCTKTLCKQCGKPIAPDSAEGLCSVCRIKARTQKRQEEARLRAEQLKAERAAKAAEEAAKAAENAAEATAETAAEAAVKTAETAATALPDTIPAGQSAAPANVAAPSLEAPRSE